MSTSAWYLVVSIVGAVFTLVALRPPHRPQILGAFAFFAAWLTTELAVLHIAWQVAGNRRLHRIRRAGLVAGLARARDHRRIVVRVVDDHRGGSADRRRPLPPRSTMPSASDGGRARLEVEARTDTVRMAARPVPLQIPTARRLPGAKDPVRRRRAEPPAPVGRLQARRRRARARPCCSRSTAAHGSSATRISKACR